MGLAPRGVKSIDRTGAATRSSPRMPLSLSRTALALGVAVAASAGCGTTTTPAPAEGGVVRAPSCDAPDVVTLVDGVESTRSFDLRTAPHGLTLGCRNVSGATDTGQVVYEVVVPGTGTHAVTVNTGVLGTDRSVDTVLAVRYTSCNGAISDDCWDENGQDSRARADFLAEGGDHVFVVLTAYYATRQGPVTVSFTARPSSPPTISEVHALLAGNELLLDVTGGDPDGDAWGVVARLHGPAGELIDLDGDGQRTASDSLRGPFARSVHGATSFVERVRIPLPDVNWVARVGGATAAYVRVIDDPGSVSDADARAAIVGGTIARHGETCDATHVCSDELLCAPGTLTCEPTPSRRDACAMAQPIPLETPTTTATSASAMGVLTEGTGYFTFLGDCDTQDSTDTSGTESLFTVTVPDAIDVDLILDTEEPGTPVDADTVVYVRSDCAEPLATMQTWCNDDDQDDPSTYLSRLVIQNAAAGTYTVFVEPWLAVQPSMTLRFELRATLRPVLPTGSSCDPTEQTDRCAGDRCSPTARTCP